MDKVEKNLLIIIIIISVVIGGIIYKLSILKNPNKNENIIIQQGTGLEENKEETPIDNKESQENKEQKEIIEEINTTSELVIDYLNREKIYDSSVLIVYGKVVEKKNTEYLKNINYPFTNGVIEVEQVIKGTLPLDSDLGVTDSKEKQKLNFKVPGGEVTVNQYINAMVDKNPEEIAKKGYDKLNEQEKENKYINIKYEYSNSFEKDKYYIMFLNTLENNYLVPTYTSMIPVGKIEEKITKDYIMHLPEVIKK